jgi:hypothetical protein
MKLLNQISRFGLHSFVVLILAAAVFSCKKDVQLGNVYSADQMGTVQGQVFAANGTRHVPAVKVFVDVNGEVFFTQTDKDGKFSLDVPKGTHLLIMHSGNGKMFFKSTQVTVEAQHTIELGGEMTILEQTAAIAYIPGLYDQIERVIIDSLGYEADELSIADLSNLNTLNNYSAIFLNCGLQSQLNQQMYDNLQAYVANGGSLYASDYAVEYLTGDGNVKSGQFTPRSHDHDHGSHTKTCTPRVGGFIPDDALCTQKQGPQGLLVGASVVSPDIQTVVGGTTMDVNYNLGAWEKIMLLGLEFEVLIADTTHGPLAVRVNGVAQWLNNGGNGSSGVNNGNFVTICHYPPGNVSNPQTITISVNALQAHLDHGCSVGPCSGTSGSILYTTFHNFPQGYVSQDTYDILQYFIMNL